jgi:hypothetical protein
MVSLARSRGVWINEQGNYEELFQEFSGTKFSGSQEFQG